MILTLCLSLLLTGCEFLDSFFSEVTPPQSTSSDTTQPSEPQPTQPSEPQLTGDGTKESSRPTDASSQDPATSSDPTQSGTDPTQPSSATKATTASDPTKESTASSEKTTTSTQQTAASSEKTTTSTKATTATTKSTTVTTKPTTTTTKATTTTIKATTTTTKATTTTTQTTTTTKPTNPPGGPLTPLAANQYYGYQYLQKQADSATLLAAYQRLVDGVESSAASISMEGISLTVDQLLKALACYRADYPQHFWIDDTKGCSYYTSSATELVTSVTLPYTLSGNTLKSARAAVESAVDSLLAGLTTANTQAEIVRTVHDRLVTLLAYDQTLSAPHTRNLYGALINHTSVCEGYAEAFHYAMYRAGIQCLSARGTGKGQSHAWNVVRVDGKYYQMDVTWDDPVGASEDSPIAYGYYLLTDAVIQKDHVINQDKCYPLPACNSTAANFLYQAQYTATMNVDSMAQALAAQANAGVRNVFYLRMSDAPSSSDLYAFVDNNWGAIRKKANAQINGWTLPGYMGSYSGNVLALIPQ